MMIKYYSYIVFSDCIIRNKFFIRGKRCILLINFTFFLIDDLTLIKWDDINNISDLEKELGSNNKFFEQVIKI